MLSDGRFLPRLLMLTLATAGGLGVLYLAILDLHERKGYMLLLLLGFAAFTYGAQVLAERIARGPNPATLLNYVMVLTFAKMVFSLALVYGYYLYARPEGKSFLWPFFLVYLAFTTFETYALIKLSFATAPTRHNEPS